MYQLTEMQQKVFDDRYALKDEYGNQTETCIEDAWTRNAGCMAEIESNKGYWTDEFYDLMYDFRFVPGGRIIVAAGGGKGTFYNCYVLPSPEDSRQGIIKTLGKMIEIMSHGGGVGINISSLRPTNAYVKGVNGRSSGSTSWGDLYSYATACISQGGSRRGALLLGLEVSHPDIQEFIIAKQTPGVMVTANLSVLITDDFMDAVKGNKEWPLIFNGVTYKIIQARSLWNSICECAWKFGEPGLLFIDQYNKRSNTWYFDKIICCNPCGEQGTPANGVCNLGSTNLMKHLCEDGSIDYIKLARTISLSVRYLDNVIDTTPYIFEENRIVQMDTRRIGLGNMGLADVLIKNKIRYGSKRAIKFINDLYQFIAIEAYKASIDLAEEKGAFAKFDFNNFFMANEKSFAYKIFKLLPPKYQEKAKKTGIRNATILTQAPTGTIGILADVSSGIEPIFAFETKRKDRMGESIVKHPLYEAWSNANHGKKVPEYFAKTQDITVEEHIMMQAAIQDWVDSSISKTINAAHDAILEDVGTAYMMAYDNGCKGVTYYRDGSIEEQVLTSMDDDTVDTLKRGYIIEALDDAPGHRVRLTTGCGHIWLMAFTDEHNNIIESFVNTGSHGGCSASTQATSRLISVALRGGVSLDDVIDQLESVDACGAYQSAKAAGRKVSPGNSCASAIAKALVKLQKKLKEGEPSQEEQAQIRTVDKCPECGEEIARVEGCKTCYSCGYSKCG